MATIRQRIPNYVSGVDPETVEFQTLDDLLDIPFVKIWKENGLCRDNNFYQYSVSEEHWGTVLMAEYNSGIKWWVVGTMKGITGKELGLPEWKPVYQKAAE